MEGPAPEPIIIYDDDDELEGIYVKETPEENDKAELSGWLSV